MRLRIEITENDKQVSYVSVYPEGFKGSEANAKKKQALKNQSPQSVSTRVRPMYRMTAQVPLQTAPSISPIGYFVAI
jgi:hypothetical protein